MVALFLLTCSMTFSVTILGSGAAIPMLHRNPSAQVVNVHEKLFLFDCAEGTQLQLRKNRIKLQKIGHIFISHLHGDHYYGLMGLITTLHLLGRTAELHVYAHEPLEKLILMNLDASQTVLRYPLVFHAIDPSAGEMVFSSKIATVTTIPLNHNFPVSGFIIRERKSPPNIRKEFLEGRELSNLDYRRIKAGADYIDPEGKVHANEDITRAPMPARAYAYCSDTAYHEPVIPLVSGVDLLYHEATFMEDRAADAAAKFHSTAIQAATIAKKAGVKRLLLGHYSARYRDLEALLAEARTVFPDTLLAQDGLVIEL